MALAGSELQNIKTLYTCLQPQGVELSLHVFDDQYMVQYRDGAGAIICKFVSAEAVRQAVLHENIDTGYMPAGVVRWGTGPKGTWAVRYEPPTRRKIYLDVPGAASEQLIVPFPAFVFIGWRGQYGVYAVSGSRFNPGSTCLRAPLPNVDDDGDICFGRNSVPFVEQDGMQRAFDLFWAAPFNDHHMQNKSREHAHDIRVRLRSLAAQGARSYPMRDLIEHNCTVDDMVRRMSQR